MLKWLKSAALALAALCVIGFGQAQAACPYAGNTTGVDSSAILAALNDICTNTASGSSASSFTQVGPSVSLAPTTSSSRVALSSVGPSAVIVNETSNPVYVKFGSASVVATTSDMIVNGGQTVVLNTGGASYIAAITASGGTTLSIVTGTGLPNISYGQTAVSDGLGIDVSGTLTASAQTVAANMDGYDSANILVSGTYAAYTITFSESPDGGTHTSAVECVVQDSGGDQKVRSYNLAANQTALFHCNNLNGSDTFVATSSNGPASGTANIDISISAFPSVFGGSVGIFLNDYAPSPVSITAADVGSASTTGQDGATIISGAPTAGSFADFTISGQNAVSAQLSGTWAGTEQFEKSSDGAIYYTFGCQTTGAVNRHSSVTGNGMFLCELGGSTHFRVRQALRTSGTVVVTTVFTSAPVISKVANGNTIIDNASGQQATIKPASTPPVATDPMLAVALVGSSTYSANVTNTALAVDPSAGQIDGYYFYNANSTVCYVQFWDIATGSVTVGTTAPKLSLALPALGGSNLAFVKGITFSSAISIAATTTRSGSTACTSGVDANVLYH